MIWDITLEFQFQGKGQIMLQLDTYKAPGIKVNQNLPKQQTNVTPNFSGKQAKLD